MDLQDLLILDFNTLTSKIIDKNENFLIELFRIMKTNHNNIELVIYFDKYSINTNNCLEILKIFLDIIKRLGKTDKFNLITLVWKCVGFRLLINNINIFEYINEPYSFYDKENINNYVLAHKELINDTEINISFFEKLINNNIAYTFDNPYSYYIKPNNIEHCIIIFNLIIMYNKLNNNKGLFIKSINTFYLFFCLCYYNTEKEVEKYVKINSDYDTLLEMNKTLDYIKELLSSIDVIYVDKFISSNLLTLNYDMIDKIVKLIGYEKIKISPELLCINAYELLKKDSPTHIKFEMMKLVLYFDISYEYFKLDKNKQVFKDYFFNHIQKIKDVGNNHLVDILIHMEDIIMDDNELLENYVIKFCELLEHHNYIKQNYDTNIEFIKNDIDNLIMTLKFIIMNIHKLENIGLSYINDIIGWSQSIFNNTDLIKEYIIDKYEYIIVTKETKILLNNTDTKIKVINDEEDLITDVIGYQIVINPYFIKSGNNNYHLIDRKTYMMLIQSKINPFTREYIDKTLMDEFNESCEIIKMRDEKKNILEKIILGT